MAGPSTSNGHASGHVSAKEVQESLGTGAVAICGMGMRLPGGICDAESFWDFLINGKDARGPIPSSRYNIQGFDASLGGHKDAIQTRHGYFLEDDLSRLDTSFFSMTKNELEKCDPQQRLLLEVTRECFEDAGETSYRGKPIGVYCGTFGDSWMEMSTKEDQHSSGYVLGGHLDIMLANRISYEYDLRGPSLVIKTGCSASLIALHEACRALENGDASAAIVGGASLITTPTTTAAMSADGLLSSEGSCKTFDAAADGFARAEAVTAVYLKPLRDALRDGNPIRAVIRGTATNSDGNSASLMSPNGEAHEALMRKVYAHAGLDPKKTAFVECHGTGTPTGDPIETTAVGKVFATDGHTIHIGSVKPNVGHSEGASGVTSLIKCVLALENKTIPPNIKFTTPNPKIPFDVYQMRVPIQPVPFPSDRSERISINSFGIGGANAHAILESFPQPETEKEGPNGHANGHTNGHTNWHTNGTTNGTTNGKANGYANGDSNGHTNGYANGSTTNGSGAEALNLVVFSANTQKSLQEQIRQHEEFCGKNPQKATDIAYTRATGRERLKHSAYAILNSQGAFTETSGAVKTRAQAPQVFLVFSGQGAQWAEMGKELLDTNAQFRHELDGMDEILQGLKYPPSWHIVDELRKPKSSSLIHTAELAQPLSTALQIALFNLLKHIYQEDAAAVVGHSSGEIAAAYAAGGLSLKQAMVLSYYRGYVAARNERDDGAMAAVGLGEEALAPYLEGHSGVVMACYNSPQSTTISGDGAQVDQIVASIKAAEPDVLARRLVVDQAYHSHHMTPLGHNYRRLVEAELSGDRYNEDLKTVLYSSVSGEPIRKALSFAPAYWEANLTSPVRFSSAVSKLVSVHGEGVFLEIGPHATLAGPLRQICSAAPWFTHVPSMLRGKDCTASLLSAVGRLYQEGVTLNLQHVVKPGKVISGLPTYPWDHSGGSYWYESRLSKAWRSRPYAHHCLLGSRTPESPDIAPQWRNMLHLGEVAWIADHRVNDDVIFPFAGYVAMAGEALRQALGIQSEVGRGFGYHLQHIVTSSALIVTDEVAVEMVTNLRRRKLTDSQDDKWFEFTISSLSASTGTWTKHCEGRVVALSAVESKQLSTRENHAMPRQVTMSRFYDTMAKIGITYGPEFQLLSNVVASPSARTASGKVKAFPLPQGEAFTLHPAAIDAALQLIMVAMSSGLGRNFSQLAVPTEVEDLEVFGIEDKHRQTTFNVTADCPGDDGLESCLVQCASPSGSPVLRLSGLRLRPLEDKKSEGDEDVHAAARLQWLPDFDFADHSLLFTPPDSNRDMTRLQEKMTLLCILETAEEVEGLTPCQPHFAKFRDWLHLEVDKAKAGKYAIIEDECQELAALSRDERRSEIEKCHQQLLEHGNKPSLAVGLKRVCDQAREIFTGQADTLDVLMEGGVLTEIYNVVSFGHADFVRLLSHTRPNLRILEVGAGTGGTTELILRDLGHGQKEAYPAYSSYTFTDVSAGFFPQAKDRFAYASNMEFKVFDISKNPFEQGFTSGAYDLILAANVIHATPSLKETLSNLQPLLRPDGMLVITELCAVGRVPNYIFGNFSGWWLGEDDGRPLEPYVSVDRWDHELKAAGFTGVETAVYDDKPPYQFMAAVMSKPISSAKPGRAATKRISIVSLSDDGVAGQLASHFQQQSHDVTIRRFGEQLPSDADVICCMDLEINFFEKMTPERFAAFQDMLRSLTTEQNILWLTKPAQIRCKDPRGAAAIGVARSIRAELSITFCTLELDTNEPNLVELVSKVFEKVRREEDADTLTADKEFAVDDGVIYLGRYQPFSLTRELGDIVTSKNVLNADTNKRLYIGHQGSLETLTWRPERVAPALPENYIELDTAAVGLNYKDVLLSMGIIRTSNDPERVNLGSECSGTVRRVGFGVTDVKVGDRVMALAPHGCFSTRAALPVEATAKIPDSMSLHTAAALSGCFTTAIHSLFDVARLQKGQSVLIHSACGGVGLAAIQLCRFVGAIVYATVGSEQKIQHLLRLGIPREQIFSSRNSSFLDGIMSATGGRGVDVVLNSVSGELLHDSWRCVAEYGVMVELSKRDLEGSAKLDMRPFLANRSYCCVDISAFIRERPVMMGNVLRRLLDWYQDGSIEITEDLETGSYPVTYFDATNGTEHAFRHVQNPNHIGKIVLTLDGPQSIPCGSGSSSQPMQFSPDKSYLLAGGTGGLGRSLATWLVERGARHLTFLSPSAGVSQSSQQLFNELRCMGCSVQAVSGTVASTDDVARAISISRYPIKGVFQLSMVLSDSNLLEMTVDDWLTATRPKIEGTWNLHEAFLGQELDFFWMASSLITALDQPGQGNYMAANTFMEAFAQYRQNLGLPASVLSICAIEGVGFVADNPVARRNVKAQGLYMLGEREFLDFVELSIATQSARRMHAHKVSEDQDVNGDDTSPARVSSSSPTPWCTDAQILMGLHSEIPLDDPANRVNWRRDRRMGTYHNVRATDTLSEQPSALKQFLRQLTAGEPDEAARTLADPATAEFLAYETGRKVHDFMLKPDEEVDITRNLSEIGLDSLMAIELRRWLRHAFGLQVTVLEIMATSSLAHLGAFIAAELKKKMIQEEI